VVRRARGGRAPWTADKAHLHHRLMELGHSQTRAVVIMYLWSALIAGTAAAVSISHRTMAVLASAAGVAVVLAVASSRPLWHRPAQRPWPTAPADGTPVASGSGRPGAVGD
jgi:UDP-GlcNAc:undecaprenyl-phosphate GlcNAc-1-phosphate transferase